MHEGLSYLSNRKQMIKFGNLISDMLPIYSGVPQGSILGQLIFHLYTNDLACVSTSTNIDLFADDSTLHDSGNIIIDVQNKLQRNLNSVVSWCVKHPVKLNA